jgi:hypothetical protein
VRANLEENMSTEVDTAVDNNNEGMTEVESGDDSVPFNLATDEELEALIQSAGEEEEQESRPVQAEEPTAAPTQEEQVKTAEGEDESQPITRAELRVLLKRLDKQEKKVDGQEILIQRRTSELGEAKKQLQQLREALKEKFNEAIENNSQADALDIRDNLKKVEQNLDQIGEEEQVIERRVKTHQLVSSFVPEEEFDVEAMAKTLARDNIPSDYIEKFKADPIGFISQGEASPALTMIHLAKRAQAEALLEKLYPVAKALEAEVRKLRGSQGDVLKKVQQVAKQTPQITAGGARPAKTNKSRTIDERSLSSLSDAELEEILANA